MLGNVVTGPHAENKHLKLLIQEVCKVLWQLRLGGPGEEPAFQPR